MFAFKGKLQNPLIELSQSTHQSEAALNCQNNAYIDGEVAIKYIGLCLVQYIHIVLHGVDPILILDNFKVHKIDKVYSCF
jgi:hypothetical protein